MTQPPRTPDGRYIVVDGVLWRATRPDLSDTERERLVREQVRLDGAAPERDRPQPRRERRGVEEVAGIEQRGEKDHARPREAARHVAHGSELRRAGEHDHAHRARLER